MLYHFSEEANIETFHPRKHPSFPERPAMVWAIDEERAPLYFFPRDCPSIGYWPTEETTEEDKLNYFGQTKAKKIIAIESAWLERVQQTTLYRYTLSSKNFQLMDEGAGYYISYETEEILQVEPVGSLLEALIHRDVEIRITPSLQLLQQDLPQSTLHFSMIRMRNAQKK